MKLRNSDQVRAFKAALDRCKSSVWIESVSGERIELGDPGTRQRGIERLIRDDSDEMELFALEYGDFLTLAHCLSFA